MESAPNLKMTKKLNFYIIFNVNAVSGKKLKFFNLGKKNDWKNLLDPKIEEQIRFKFNKEMKELGYN